MVSVPKADHIGSLLRPPEVHQVRADYAAGSITLDRVREIEDAAILRILEKQRQIGIDVFSDGEFRRAWYSGAFTEAV